MFLKIRQTNDTPVIMLTALDQDIDKVMALEWALMILW